VAAALLLGATARALHEEKSPIQSRYKILAAVPIVLVVSLYAALTAQRSLRWMRNADVSATVLNQIAALPIKPKPNAFLVLRYSDKDKDRRLIEGLGWGFGSALQVLYSSPTLDGKLLQEGAACPECEKQPVINLIYTLDSQQTPRVTIGQD
jgi:hypothetical protein